MARLDKELEELKANLHAAPAPPFGHACRALYGFDEEFVALNNGSFGACPQYVIAAHNAYLRHAERRPDDWHRGAFRAYLNHSRKEVAALVNAEVDDIVLVNNATTGVNAVLRGMQPYWSTKPPGQDGLQEAIMVYDTVYGACGKTAQFIVDSNPALNLGVVRVPMQYPVSHEEFLAKTEAALVDARKQGIKIKIAIVDAISSLPGVVVPWREAVKLLRKHDVLSLVDGAHAVGQIALDLKQADPDFFVSNCHKWLNAHRGCALLYAPKRNQHLVPGMPTSHYYINPLAAPQDKGVDLITTDAPSNFVAVWEFSGTVDLSNFCSLSAALDYRRWLGGEEKIRAYTSDLAHKGGTILCKELGSGSKVMNLDDGQADRSLTASMVNVLVPVNYSTVDTGAFPTKAHISAHLQSELSSRLPTFVPFYVHDEAIWIRVSAQVWLEESDFEWLGKGLSQLLASLGWSAPVE